MNIKLFHNHPTLRRIEVYLGMLLLIVVIALLAHATKNGPAMMALHIALSDIWHAMIHFLTEVACAEVGAFTLVRLFGIIE